MEFRPVEVKLMSAKDLKDVNVFSKMDVYVIGSVSGDPRSIQKTAVDKDGGVNPKWNFDMKFTVDESAARLNRLALVFQIMSDRTLGDKEIGRVYVPFKDLFQSTGAGDNSDEVSGKGQHVTYQVQTPSGKFKGQLEFSYKFGERFIQSFDRRLDELVLPYTGTVPPGPGPGPGLGMSGFEPSLIPAPSPALGGHPASHGHGAPTPEYSGNGNGFGYNNVYSPNPQTGYGFGCPGQGLSAAQSMRPETARP